MGGSIKTGPQNRPKYTVILTIGTTKMGPLVLGHSHMSAPTSTKSAASSELQAARGIRARSLRESVRFGDCAESPV